MPRPKAAYFVRACAVEKHVKMSQEQLYEEIYGKNAALQNRTAHFVLACVVERHVKMSHKSHFMKKFTEKMPRSNTALHTLR